MLFADSPEEILKTIKEWIKEHGKFNVDELNEPTTYFTLRLSAKKDPNLLPFSVIYPRGFQLEDAITVGWAWKFIDDDIRAYASIKDNNLKRNLIDSIRSICHSKGLKMSVEPNEYNMQAIRVSKPLQIGGLTKDEFTEILDNIGLILAFVMNEFEKNNMSRARFDPLTP